MLIRTVTQSFVNGFILCVIAAIVAISVLEDLWLPLLGVLASIGFVLFTLTEPFKGLLCWVLLSPFLGSYIHIRLPAGIPTLTFARVMVVCVLLGLLIQMSFTMHRAIIIGTIEKVMMLFLSVVFLSILLRSDNATEQVLQYFDIYAIPFLFFFVAKNLVQAEDDLKKLYYILLWLGLYTAMYGVYQYAMHGIVTLSSHTTGTGHLEQGRAVGPFVHAAEYGGVLVITFLSALYLALYESSGFKRCFIVLVLGLIVIGILFSLTRAVWIEFVAALFVISIFDRKWKRIFKPFIFLLAAMYIIVVLVSPRLEERAANQETGKIRLVLYKTAFFMSMAKPLTGYGMGVENFVIQRRAYLSAVGTISSTIAETTGPPHNDLLFIFVQLGLIGLVPYITILLLILRSSLFLRRLSVAQQSFAYRSVIFFWGVLTIYLVHGLFGEIASLTFLSSLFYILGGALDGLRLRSAVAAPPDG